MIKKHESLHNFFSIDFFCNKNRQYWETFCNKIGPGREKQKHFRKMNKNATGKKIGLCKLMVSTWSLLFVWHYLEALLLKFRQVKMKVDHIDNLKLPFKHIYNVQKYNQYMPK